MNRQISTLVLTLATGSLALMLVLTLGTYPAFAHGDAVLTVSPDAAALGETVTVAADGVEAGETFAIVLISMKVEFTLGSVTVSDDDDFHQDFTIPEDAPPGTYQVTATSEDGETLSAELVVLEAREGIAVQETTKPSEAPMDLDRSKSPTQISVIIALVALSVGLGTILVRTRK